MNGAWTRGQVALHWGSAILVVGLAAAGFVMSDLADDSGLRLLFSRMHTFMGLTLMVITVVRVAVRWKGKKPPPLALSPLHQRGIAAVHGLMVAALFGIGASGLLTAVQSEWPRYLRGDVAVVPVLKDVASRGVHEFLVFTLIALVFLHVGGVLVQELRHGGVLRRMLPWTVAPSHSPKDVP